MSVLTNWDLHISVAMIMEFSRVYILVSFRDQKVVDEKLTGIF